MPSFLAHMHAQPLYNYKQRLKNPEFHSATSYKMAVEFCTPAEIEDHLETLKFLFLCLPDTVPNGSQFYNFTHFVPNPDKVELSLVLLHQRKCTEEDWE